MRPVTDEGHELDALFSIEKIHGGFDLIVESRGGSENGPNRRNRDYAPAMSLHLARMKALDMVLAEVQCASSVAMNKPEGERTAKLDQFKVPLELSEVADLEALRFSIGRASAAFDRQDNRGNNTKRMRLRMRWSKADELSAADITGLLARRLDMNLPVEMPTSDPAELSRRVEKAKAAIRSAAKRGFMVPPPGQKTVPKHIVHSSSFARDPNVIAWVLNEADGKCEVCIRPAPFFRTPGEPYLEVHHVRPLGEGGPDTIDNAIACCPNCHRRLHYDPACAHIRLDLIARVPRLIDYPLMVDMLGRDPELDSA